MKSCLLAVCASIALAGCSTADLMDVDGERYFRVFQTLPDGALAFRCNEHFGERCSGLVVFLPNSVDPSMFDEKLLHLNNPVIIDRYTYPTKMGERKVVPVIIDK